MSDFQNRWCLLCKDSFAKNIKERQCKHNVRNFSEKQCKDSFRELSLKNVVEA